MGWRRRNQPHGGGVCLCQQRPAKNQPAHMSCRRAGGALNWGFSTPMHAVWPSVSGRARSRLSCRGLPAALSANWQAPVSRRWPCAAPTTVSRAHCSPKQRAPCGPKRQSLRSIEPQSGAPCERTFAGYRRARRWGVHCRARSTIIGCLEETPTLLRVGGLSRNALETCLNRSLAELPENADRTARLAPGRMLRHYAPRAPLCIVAKPLKATICCWVSDRERQKTQRKI